MYALFEIVNTDSFRRKPINYFLTPMPNGVGVRKVFAELSTESDRLPISKRMPLISYT